MTITTYATLVDAITDYMKDSTLSTPAPTFIQLAEAEFNRILYNMDAEETSTTSTVAAQQAYSLPDDFRAMRSLYIDNSSGSVVLKQLSPDDFYAKWLDVSDALPQEFAIIGNELHLGPAPDAVYSLKLVYVQGLTALDDTNTSNWLLEDHPDLYLFGSLLQAEFYGWNDDRLPLIKSRVDELLGQVRAADARKRRGNQAGDVAGTYF